MKQLFLLLLLFPLGFSAAQVAEVDDLLVALRKARVWEARGTVLVTVNFPPRETPTRVANRLPVVAVRPYMLARTFTVVKGAAEMVAGRQTTRFDLTPLNADAGRWTVWVDQVWNVPLAFEERGPDGSLARQAVFQKVNPKLVQGQSQVPTAPEGLRGAILAALPGFRFPAGFAPISAKQVSSRFEVTLSDGLNTLSLVVAPRNVKAAPGVASRKVGTRFVWLVGNMPQAALQSAIAQVKQVNEAALGTFLPPQVSNP